MHANQQLNRDLREVRRYYKREARLCDEVLYLVRCFYHADRWIEVANNKPDPLLQRARRLLVKAGYPGARNLRPAAARAETRDDLNRGLTPAGAQRKRAVAIR